jgi:hypothetical protein
LGSSPSFRWIGSNFGIAPSTKNVKQLVESARHALNSQQNDGATVTKRHTENVFCKVYRDNGDSIMGKQFCDLVFPGQCLFSISESDCVIHQPGTAPVCISGCLVTEWQCQKTMARLPRILQNLKLPAGGIPTNGVIENVLLPPKFLNGNNKV